MKLSQAEADQYERDGYVVVRGVLGESEGGLQVPFDGLPMDFGRSEGCSGVGDLFRHPRLLFLE